MSGLLRHFPYDYDLNHTSNGWFNIKDIQNCINNKYDEDITISEIESIVKNDSKGRYEIDTQYNIIRAVYGHSINVTINKQNTDNIPSVLYHGTPKRNKKSILSTGLKSQNRQEVHMTDSISEAKNVGKRHSSNIIVFKIDIKSMKSDGYTINNPTGDSVYTVSDVPSKYLSII